MVDKREKRLVREDEPSQRTKKNIKIPVPKRGEFFRNLGKVAKTDSQTKGSPKQ